MTRFKSDDRPSDTKSVVLHKENDRRLIEYLANLKGQTESQAWRDALYHYLDSMEWYASHPDAPKPNQPFVYYKNWLEQRLAQPASVQANIDLESIVAAILPGMRDVVEAAVSTALAGLNVSSGTASVPVEVLELADRCSPELVLE